MAVRFLRSRSLTLEDYVDQGVMTGPEQEVRQLLAERRNIIVSGGTGTGKTTLLRALLRIATTEGLVIIEDTPELAVPGDNVVHLHTTLEPTWPCCCGRPCVTRPTGSRWARFVGRKHSSWSAP